MNPEVKKQWVEALRSGEYEQTDCALHDERGFCCLGVLCDLHAKATGGKWDESHYERRYQGVAALLPPLVCEWAQLPYVSHYDPDGTDVDITKENKTMRLATLNDDGVSFTKIADYIDECL